MKFEDFISNLQEFELAGYQSLEQSEILVYVFQSTRIYL